MRTWIFMKRDVRQKNKRWSNGLFAVFIFWALHSNIFKFHPLGLGFLSRWLINSRFLPSAVCHMSFFLLFSMILPSCFSMFERRLHTFFLLRSLDLDLNLSVCSIQHQKEPSSESFAFFAAIKLLFQSNSIPLRIHLPFCPLIFRYSAWSSIVLNTRWTYSQSFASNCNGCLVSLPAW